MPLQLGNVARKGADLLGLVKMAPSGWRYYAEEVALGLEDYYAGRGEAPGRWTGSGAAALGLAGQVRAGCG